MLSRVYGRRYCYGCILIPRFSLKLVGVRVESQDSALIAFIKTKKENNSSQSQSDWLSDELFPN